MRFAPGIMRGRWGQLSELLNRFKMPLPTKLISSFSLNIVTGEVTVILFHAVDAAMSGKGQYKLDKGGIDLNSANLAMTIKRDGNGIPIFSRQDLARFSDIEGLDPVILSIKPASQTALFAELVGR